MVDRRLCATALVLIAGLFVLEIPGVGQFGAATQSLAADAKDAKDNKADIAKQQIALAKEALLAAAESEKQGKADPGLRTVSIWSKRLVEATRKSGANKLEVTQEIKSHLARMEARAEIMKARQQAGEALVTDVLNAKYEALEARAWLAEEQGE